MHVEGSNEYGRITIMRSGMQKEAKQAQKAIQEHRVHARIEGYPRT